jgi:hypothetical protein
MHAINKFFHDTKYHITIVNVLFNVIHMHKLHSIPKVKEKHTTLFQAQITYLPIHDLL